MFSHIDPKNYQAQLDEKHQDMTELFAEFDLPAFEIYESEPINYRQRAEFRVWHDGDDLFYIMFDQATKQKFRVDYFPVASTLINELMTALLDNIRNHELLRRKLFQVDFLTTLSGEAVISMLYHKPLTEEWQQACAELKQTMSSICPINFIGRARKQKIIVDQDYVNEVLTVDGKQFTYEQIENSFTQPNGKVNEKMLLWAKQATSPVADKTKTDLVELYCGNGNFSIALAENFSRVLGTEISKTSVNSAQRNIASNSLDNVKIVRMSSEEFSLAMMGQKSFRRLGDLDLTTYDYETVLVDPPRAGLDDDSVELVSRFKTIIYISCNPETLADNLKTLVKTHNIEKAALFDQFPYTHHIETGVILTRK